MNLVQKTITVSSSQRCQMIDITPQVQDILIQSRIKNGFVTVYTPHTTAGITINENADPDVVHDILLTLNSLLPANLPGYRHGEGNSDAHVKSSLIGCSQQILLDSGKMKLGTWQGLYFCDFDGPRTRKVFVQITGE